MRTFFKRLGSAYKACALLSFNTLIFYVLLNVCLAAVFVVRDALRSDPVSEKYGDKLKQVYPDMGEEQMTAMLSETWSRPFVYADFTHFAERPFTGSYVNVAGAGFRKSVRQGPWPMQADNINVFVFGGSTTFGYGLPDEQTLPSRLQEALRRHTTKRVCAYNFGVGYYYSTQERLSFEKLLFQGHVPDIAVFVDGLNDFERGQDNKPAFSDIFAQSFERLQDVGRRSPGRFSRLLSLFETVYRKTPVERAVNFVRWKTGLVDGSPGATAEAPEAACNGYLHNKALIEESCRRFGVTPLFVWQPIPGYKYDMKYHRFAAPEEYEAHGRFYALMAARVQHDGAGNFGQNFLWCADIQKDEAKCLYVDSDHYTAEFTVKLANSIVDLCRQRRLLRELGFFEE